MNDKVEMKIFNQKVYLQEHERDKIELLLFNLRMLGCQIVSVFNEESQLQEVLTITIIGNQKRANLQLHYGKNKRVCNIGVHSKDFDKWESNIDEASNILIDYF